MPMAIASDSITAPPPDSYATHEVRNQPGTLADYNAFTTDRPLTEAVRALGAEWAWEKLRRAGAIVGSEEGQQLARLANRHLPSCAPTTGSAIGSIRWSSTPPIMS
jgi:putative acyl-CoA dehydrogenase